MHVRWNDLDKQPPSARKIKKPLHIEDSDARIEPKSNKPVNTDLYQALFPLYYLSKACGLLPVRFTEQPSGRYSGRLHVIDIIYSVALVLFLVTAEIYGLWRDLRDGWEQSTRLKSQAAVIVTCSDVAGIMSLTCVSILGSPFRWKHLQAVIDKLVEVDGKLGITAPKKTRRFTIILISVAMTYLVSTSILDIIAWDREAKLSKKKSDKGAINYAPLYLMYVTIITMEVQYALSAYNVCQRFSRLNASLENILKTGQITEQFRKDLGLAGDMRDQVHAAYVRQDVNTERLVRRSKIIDWYSSTYDNRNFAENISQFVTVHAALCDSVSYINSAFGVAMLAVTITCLLHLIIAPYFLIMEAGGKQGWLFLLIQISWICMHTARMLVVVQPSYAATIQAKKTAVLVSQLLSSNVETDIRKHLEAFSLQLLHRPLDFSACGLFSLDRALVTSIAGAVTTYLVILIQFQNADESKGAVDNFLRNATQQILKNATSIRTNLTLQQSASS